jgi:NADH-quinone oxidoreductase subunit M
MLWMYQRVIFGEAGNKENLRLRDLDARERLALAPMIVLIFVMGIYPMLFLSRSNATVAAIRQRVNPTEIVTAEQTTAGKELEAVDR